MFSYRIQEADLLIPPDWTDQSLTIFKLPGTQGVREASFVITRDSAKGDLAFDEYVAGQVTQCEAKLPGYLLRLKNSFVFQNYVAARLEYTWKNGKVELYIRQVFYDRGPQVLICTLTTTEADLRHHDRAWRQVMGKMTLQPLPLPMPDDVQPFPPPDPA